MPQPIQIDEFLLDPQNECLWRGEESIPLRPKAYALLRHLVDHPGRILTKGELLDAVWGDAIVGDAVLKVCVRELRKALGDTSSDSRFIETVHRRGYRWRGPSAPKNQTPQIQAGPRLLGARPAAQPILFGRNAERTRLQEDFARAQSGVRQIVFISGEPGIGKTALCAAFLASLEEQGETWVAKGQCAEHFGTGEAYLPVLEALTALARGPVGAELKPILRSLAPTWLAQLPALLPDEGERRDLERELFGATQGRMLREMSDALEALSTQRTIVLLFEDLHWADPSTADLLGAIARRTSPARLMILGTLRPVDLIVHGHPLRRILRDLEARGSSHELRLSRLEAADSSNLVARLLGGPAPEPELSEWIHRQTSGNPLFALNLLDSLRKRSQVVREADRWVIAGELDSKHVPEGVLSLLEEMIERRDPEECRTLEAASIAGVEFSSGAVAAILELDQAIVEDRCTELVNSSHLLEALGSAEFPDGTPIERYRFTHAFYVAALQRRIPATRRRRYHERNAERGVSAYGPKVGHVAAELADQFERADQHERAVALYLVAADECARRFAMREAEQHLERALAAPSSSDAGLDSRISTLERLGLLRRARGDFAASAEAFANMAEVARGAHRVENFVNAKLYEASVSSWLGRRACLDSMAAAQKASESLPEGLLRIHTRGAGAYWHLLWQGRREEDAQACEAARDGAQQAGDPSTLTFHTVRASWFYWLGGKPTQAVESARVGAALCVEQGDWFDYLLARFFLSWTLLHAGTWSELRRVLDDSRSLAQRNGHTSWIVLFELMEAWLHMEARSFEVAYQHVLNAEERAVGLDNPFIAFFARTIGGFARQGVGDTQGAQADFEAVLGSDAGEVLMGWVLAMIAGSGLARLHLGAGRLDEAHREASRTLEVAESAGERTAAAVARRTLAEVAFRQTKKDVAKREITRALAHLEGDPTPLAAWRVHLTAAEIFGTSKPQLAEQHRTRARQTAESIAASLADGDPLRESLLSNPDFDPSAAS